MKVNIQTFVSLCRSSARQRHNVLKNGKTSYWYVIKCKIKASDFSSFHRQLTDEHRRRSLEEESVWLRIRSLTLRLLASLAELGHSPSQQNSEMANENGVGDKTSILGSLLSQLNQTLQTAAQIAEKRMQVRSVNEPSRAYVHPAHQ